MSSPFCTVLLLMFVMAAYLTGGARGGRRLAVGREAAGAWRSHKSPGHAFLTSCLCCGIICVIYWVPVPRRGTVTLVLVGGKSGKRLGSHPHTPAPPHCCVACCLRRHGTDFYRRPLLARACSLAKENSPPTPSLTLPPLVLLAVGVFDVRILISFIVCGDGSARQPLDRSTR